MPLPEQPSGSWVDIQALPVPAEAIHSSLILTIIGVVILLVVLGYYLWRRPKFVAHRQIRHLQKHPNTRQQLFLLNQALQQAFQVHNIEHISFEGQLQRDWQAFCHELVHQRFAAPTPSRTDVSRLHLQAYDWLRRV